MATMGTSGRFYLSVAGCTDVGRLRKKNEDAYVVADLTGGTLLDGSPHKRFDVGERGVLLAVSDGMGGAHAGEVASALVLETLTRVFEEATAETPRDALMNEAIQKAHVRVRDAGGPAKMGATLTAVFVHAGQAYIAEVGDSRAYLVRAGQITQLTHDQSMVQILIDAGAITQEEAQHSPLRSQILQAMGHQPNVKVALGRLDLRERDCLVLCSDGLTNHVTDDEIREVVTSSGPPAAVRRLVDLANERGGKDNITVVVAGAGGELEAAKPGEEIDETFEVLTTFEAPVPKR
jgi:serine/threonine protein phosphatase PrpC